jgi:hypothetical protein
MQPQFVRTLQMAGPCQPGGPSWLSAASGLVRAGAWLHVVADDELHLARFAAAGTAPGHWLRLFPGELDAKHEPRKRTKPDTESIALLPPTAAAPGGELLVLGSGSGPLRRTAARVPLDRDGAPAGPVGTLDLTAFFAALEALLPELNIEGAVVRGAALTLLHRGNKGGARNALVTLPLAALTSAVEPRDCVVQEVALGDIGDTPLTLTDGVAHPDGGLLVTAVAEDTSDRYRDGPCRGAALAHLGDSGALHWILPLDGGLKPEGIALGEAPDGLECLLVTDPDDRREPARLYRLLLASARAAT